ncbi:MAG: hypothetical protein ACJAS4_002608 [Bacteriovoracaceae bacterium]|jgi:hypothetical protein
MTSLFLFKNTQKTDLQLFGRFWHLPETSIKWHNPLKNNFLGDIVFTPLIARKFVL